MVEINNENKIMASVYCSSSEHFHSDSSTVENIAFGIPKEQINHQQVVKLQNRLKCRIDKWMYDEKHLLGEELGSQWSEAVNCYS